MKRQQASLSDFWGKKSDTAPDASQAKKQRPAANDLISTDWTSSQAAIQRVAIDQTSPLATVPITTITPLSPTPDTSDDSSTAAPPLVPPTGFQPFANRELYVCPYVATAACQSDISSFDTYKKLCGHVKSAHVGEELPETFAENPFEDGTKKIPCPHTCGERFTTYQKANHHGKSQKTCPTSKRDVVHCSWPDCTFESSGKDPEKGMANHVNAKHSKDTRSAFQCSKCARYHHMNLYKLAMHEERCKPSSVATEEKTTMRFKLNKAAEQDKPPTFIIVSRSSGRVPEGWKAGTGNYRDGLPILGRAILAHFAEKSGQKTGAAILHTAYECPTRRVPALAHDLSYLETNNRQKKMVYRGFKFTQAIVNDIEAANQAGIKPFLISRGVDGFFCDLRMIIPWLQATKLNFELVIKVNSLQYGLTNEHAEFHGNVYWWHHQPEDLLVALENGSGYDPKVDELRAAWTQCQDSKDTQYGINKRRNFVDLQTIYPLVE